MSCRFFKTDNEVAVAILAQYGPSTFAVYSILKVHEWESGRTGWPSVPKIAEEAHVSEATTKRSLKDLEDAGYICRKAGDGRGNRTEYQIKGFTEIPLSDPKGVRQNTPLQDKGVHQIPPLGDKGVQNNAERGSQVAPLHNKERASERREEERQERVAPLTSRPPSLETFLGHAKRTGVDLIAAEKCWNHHELKGWPNNGAKWDLVLRSWHLGDVQRKLSEIPLRAGGRPPPEEYTPPPMDKDVEEAMRRDGLI